MNLQVRVLKGFRAKGVGFVLISIKCRASEGIESSEGFTRFGVQDSKVKGVAFRVLRFSGLGLRV